VIGAAIPVALLIAMSALYLGLPEVASLKTKNPTTTALIEQRAEEAREKGHRFSAQRTWVGLGTMSPKLVAAVLLSEDASFYMHEGFDWKELEKAVDKDIESRSYARGASTITQQLAKNLFLGTRKSILRKVEEALLTVKLEHTLSKPRILALYLNVAEWGEGVFGAEAGARAHFGIPASEVDAAQSAVLAAMLPAPRHSSLKAPDARLRFKSHHILELMHVSGRIDDHEYESAKSELDRLVGA
jgi:monofunctional biosynthetic peptidoglycan transglycosylase